MRLRRPYVQLVPLLAAQTGLYIVSLGLTISITFLELAPASFDQIEHLVVYRKFFWEALRVMVSVLLNNGEDPRLVVSFGHDGR